MRILALLMVVMALSTSPAAASPLDLLAVEPLRDAASSNVAVSGTGDASSCGAPPPQSCRGALAASGTGDAESGLVAVSGSGHAHGGLLAASALGTAESERLPGVGPRLGGGHWLATARELAGKLTDGVEALVESNLNPSSAIGNAYAAVSEAERTTTEAGREQVERASPWVDVTIDEDAGPSRFAFSATGDASGRILGASGTGNAQGEGTCVQLSPFFPIDSCVRETGVRACAPVPGRLEWHVGFERDTAWRLHTSTNSQGDETRYPDPALINAMDDLLWTLTHPHAATYAYGKVAQEDALDACDEARAHLE